MQEYLRLLWAFLRVGMFTFGGGYAMIPVVERELINKRAWITMDEVMDYYTVSQITPGLIGVNLSTFVGYKHKGIFGGIIATLGFVFPGAMLVTAAAVFLSNLADIPAINHAFTGIRIAVGALILDTVIKLVKGVFKQYRTLLLYIFVFVFSILPSGLVPSFFTSPVFLILTSGIIGLVIFRQKKPETGGAPPAQSNDSDNQGGKA